MERPRSYPHLVALLQRLHLEMLSRVSVTSQVENWWGHEFVIWLDVDNSVGLQVTGIGIFPIKGRIPSGRRLLKVELQPVLRELQLNRRRPNKPDVANKKLTAIVCAAASVALKAKMKTRLGYLATRPKKK